MLLLATYWKQIAIALAFVSVMGYAKVQSVRLHSAQANNASCEATIEGYKVKSEQAKSDAIIEKQKSDKITKTVADSYEYQLKQIKEYYAKHPNTIIKHELIGGVSIKPDSSTSQASVYAATEGTDAITTYTPTIEDCAITTSMLVNLQKWVSNENNLCEGK